MEKIQKDLGVIEFDQGEYFVLPAQSSLEDVYQNPHCPDILRSTLQSIVWQRRVEYKIERVMLSPNLAPSWAAALLALGAKIHFSETGETNPLEKFLYRAGSQSQKFSGVLVPVHIPGRVCRIQEVSRTPSEPPIVFAAVVLQIEQDFIHQARIAFTGVWPKTTRLAKAADLLLDKALSEELIEKVASAVEQEVNPADDFLGGITYRKAMARVLTRRALLECLS